MYVKKCDGIFVENGMSFDRLRQLTKLSLGYWIDDVGSYDRIKRAVKNKQLYKMNYYGINYNELVELDEYQWNIFYKVINDSVMFVNEACKEYGVNEVESHLVSVKLGRSVISKTRSKFYKTMDALTNYTPYATSPLTCAINIMYDDYCKMMPENDYKFTAIAAETSNFRNDVAWETVRLLEETGTLIYAKLNI